MQELIGLSVEMGIVSRTLDEAIRHLAAKQDIIHEAIHDALGRARDDFDMAMTLVDTSKSLITRDMLARRRAGPTPEGASGTVVMAMTRPQMADQYVQSSPDTALCSFYLGPQGDLWALIVQNLGDGRPLGKAVLGITNEGRQQFAEGLESYLSRGPGEAPNFDLQAELLKVLGTVLIPFFVRMKIPRKLVFIPHRGLHLLPLHAMFVETEHKRLYLDGFVAEIVYASCITELLYANVRLAREEGRKRAALEPRLLAALDKEAAGLSWIEVERSQFDVVRKLGYPVDIATTYDELPTDLTSYVFINWSGHAISDPYRWGQSRLTFGGCEIAASTIASDWHLHSGPVVTLAACEGATNQPMAELLDEYCGLDRALRIAGAREVTCCALASFRPIGGTSKYHPSTLDAATWCVCSSRTSYLSIQPQEGNLEAVASYRGTAEGCRGGQQGDWRGIARGPVSISFDGEGCLWAPSSLVNTAVLWRMTCHERNTAA